MSQSTKSIMRDANALAQLWRGGSRYEAPSPELKSFHEDHEWEAPKTRIRLDVPYADKDRAKALGARWDTTEKTWWAYELTDGLKKWLPSMPTMLQPELPAKKQRTNGFRGKKPKATPKPGFTLYDPAHEFSERFQLEGNP